MKISLLVVAAMLTAPLMWSQVAAAQEIDGSPAALVTEADLQPAEPDPRDELRSLRITFDAGTFHQFDTDIDDAGSFSKTRGFLAAGLSTPLADKLLLRTAVTYDLSHWNFDDVTRFGGNDPWENIHTFNWAATLHYEIDETWSVFGGPLINISGESDADVEDSITGGGAIGATWRASDNLSISLGFTITSELEDDTRFFPLILINWEFAPAWALRTASLDAGSSGGGGIEIAHEIAEPLTLAAGVGYLRNRYRLDDDPGFAPDGIGENSRIPLFLRATYRPAANISLSALGGFILGGELVIEDRDGSQLFEEDYDPAAFLGLNLRVRF